MILLLVLFIFSFAKYIYIIYHKALIDLLNVAINLILKIIYKKCCKITYFILKFKYNIRLFEKAKEKVEERNK